MRVSVGGRFSSLCDAGIGQVLDAFNHGFHRGLAPSISATMVVLQSETNLLLLAIH